MKHPSLPIAVLSLIVCAWGLVVRAADATPANPNILVILAIFRETGSERIQTEEPN